MYMVSHVATRNVINLKQAISSEISTHKSRGYVFTYILVDNESAITTAIPYVNELGVTVNQTSRNEHVP